MLVSSSCLSPSPVSSVSSTSSIGSKDLLFCCLAFCNLREYREEVKEFLVKGAFVTFLRGEIRKVSAQVIPYFDQALAQLGERLRNADQEDKAYYPAVFAQEFLARIAQVAPPSQRKKEQSKDQNFLFLFDLFTFRLPYPHHTRFERIELLGPGRESMHNRAQRGRALLLGDSPFLAQQRRFIGNGMVDEREKKITSIPSEIGYLSRLENLSFEHQNIENMENCPPLCYLRVLKLAHCRLTSFEGRELFPQLIELDLSYNRIKDLGALKLPPNLSILRLKGNQISTFEGLTKLRFLTKLNLKNNALSSFHGLPYEENEGEEMQINIRGNFFQTYAGIFYQRNEETGEFFALGYSVEDFSEEEVAQGVIYGNDPMNAGELTPIYEREQLKRNVLIRFSLAGREVRLLVGRLKSSLWE